MTLDTNPELACSVRLSVFQALRIRSVLRVQVSELRNLAAGHRDAAQTFSSIADTYEEIIAAIDAAIDERGKR